ncbi:MAG: M20/M25/M40 family metallo-hydrolase, partial [Gemmatimonadales bacterium]
TLRTIAPEYEWVVSPDGGSLLVSAERDGNTISPERGVFRIDLGAEVTMDALTRRLEANLAWERELVAEGEFRFAPLHDEVARVTGAIQTGRVHNHADQLYRMGSKFIGQPGNLEATEYLRETLEGWGYEVTMEWFEPRGMRAANVIARLPGTENPELIYAISSHFDSVLPSPGADDNTSGTTALLEAARVLAQAPRKATIEFAFLTAEEAGLLGAREYVRRMVEEGRQLVGVLNNDMIGWTRSHRLDNTIRYSNPGIMKIQHGAAMRYSDLITYDALYYRGTDGAVFYEAYGDIVGGIGSYPVLGNPHYHQRTDQVETINHRLVAEVSRTTVASIMLLADSPSRIRELRLEGARTGSTAAVAWEPALESGVTGYRVQVRRPDGEVRELGVTGEPRFTVADVQAGDVVEVRAIGAGGLEGWDWARLELP